MDDFPGPTPTVGDIGKTEQAASAEAGAHALYWSAQKKALPDYLPVLPRADAGSLCEKEPNANPVSMLGFERLHNKAFQIDCEEEFVTFMSSDVPSPDAAAKRAMNVGR